MGLDTTHGCWHGSYSGFHNWRKVIAKAAGYDLEDLWHNEDATNSDVLMKLLIHSDCDGDIKWEVCEALAQRLEEILPSIQPHPAWPNLWEDKTEQFIEGLKEAASKKENVEFR